MGSAAESYEVTCVSSDIGDKVALAAEQTALAERTADTVLALTRVAMDLAGIKRVPRYDSESRENDAEHSYMLALIAPELASQFFPHLNTGLVAEFSGVHELVELETKDVATYMMDNASIAAKETADREAVKRLATKLPPHTRGMLLRYEAQEEPEARFVRLIDKLLPVAVDILGPGKQVMAEDYGIETVEQLKENEYRLRQQLRERFPDTWLDFLHVVRDILADRFTTVFE